MRMKSSVLIATAGAGMMLAASVANAGALNGPAIKGLFPGSFEAHVQGYRVSFVASKSGGLKGVAYGQQDQGRWFVKGNSLCVTWKRWTKGQAKCGAIAQQGGWYVAHNGSGEMLKFRRAMVAQQ